MCKSILIKQIWFKDKNKDRLNFDEKYEIKTTEDENYDSRYVINNLSKEEWKSYIFGHYENKSGEYKKREKIYVINKSLIDENKTEKEFANGETISLKIGPKTTIGKGTINNIKIDTINNVKYNVYEITNLEVLINNEYKTNINELFEFNEERIEYNKNDSFDKKKYLNGLFKIFYKSIELYFKDYFYKGYEKLDDKTIYNIPGNKLSAYYSYLAIKDVFNKNGLTISQLDSFVKNNKLEYDALVLKDKINKNKRLYDEEKIKATIEIKTSGYFTKGTNDKTNIKDKLLVKNNFEEYMKNEHIKNITHIYIALHENIGVRSDTINYYEIAQDVLKEHNNDYIFIFCKLKSTNDHIIIPKEYDLEKIIEKLKNTN